MSPELLVHESSSCLVCDQRELIVVEGFSSLPRITSDCRPFSVGGELYVCGCCGAVQKLPNERWLQEINQIYKGYAAYELAGGEEQLVFDSATNCPLKRSDVLMHHLVRTGALPASCKAIDVGCGHGVTLRAMRAAFPDWQLFGHELNEGNTPILAGIPGFQRLYTGNLAQIDEMFGFGSMIHSLEHFVSPLVTLTSLRKKIALGGHLFIQVCNIEENPFDLLVADHLMHFSPATLAGVVRNAGFAMSQLSTAWVKKELSLLAVAVGPSSVKMRLDTSNAHRAARYITESVSWLRALIEQAEASTCGANCFGLFGTSIAATWLATVLGNSVNFFVDEDPHRIGRYHMDRLVVHPSKIPTGSTVYMPLAPVLAEAIKARLGQCIPGLVLPLPFRQAS